MRIRVRPELGAELDVDVEVGLPVRRLRAHLALMTADPGWARDPLWVATALLDDDHPVGTAPLLPGSVLARHPGPPDDSVACIHAGAHLAVLSGPGAGQVLPLPARRTITVPPGWTDGDRLRLRVGRMCWVQGRRWSVHRRRPARLPWPVDRRAHPRARRALGPRVGVLRTGDRVGGTGWHAELRREPSPAPHRPRRRIAPVRLIALVAAVAGPITLALSTRQWAYLALGLAGPAMLLGAPLASDGAAVPDAPDVATDVPALRLAAARHRLGTGPGVCGTVPWGTDGALAVIGPRADEVAAALVLLCAGSPSGAALVVMTGDPARWRWVDWLDAGTRLPTADDPPTVVVADDSGDGAALAEWRAAGLGEHRLLIVSPHRAPAWVADRVLTDGEARLVRVDGRRARFAVPSVAEDCLDATARELASARTPPDDGRPPHEVALGALDSIPIPDPVAVRAGWDRAEPGLVVPLGRAAGARPYQLDLVRDGPHVLIGGTTGSGKSQLLISLVLAAACRQPPARLAMLLVDFKGGTGVGAVAGLPHVLEHLSDLEPARAARTLSALGAELRRRERVLLEAGAADLCELDPQDRSTPPRLLVVVDEFRALLDDVPSAGAVLARLAAQGRALGIHLVLATQRPGGAVGPDLRANVSLRVALRVADPQDSTDLLGTADAVRIDRRTPGRALVRAGAAAPVEVQLARAVLRPAGAAVRHAASWPTPAPSWHPLPRAGDDAASWVEAIDLAAVDRSAPAVPWLPELGALVRPEDVPQGPGLAIAVADRPDELAREPVRWEPTAGHLLVVGAPGSGRTTALLAAGAAALDAGYQVHAVGLPAHAQEILRRADHEERLGTFARHEDALLVARLLDLLDVAAVPRTVLLIDGLDATLEALGRLARGAGAERLTRLWTAGTARPVGPALACSTGPGTLATRTAPSFADRIVLALRDAGAAAVLGVPSSMAAGGPPGRAVHLSTGGARVCQVVMPHDGAPGGPAAGRAGPTPGLPAGRERAAGGSCARRAAPGPTRLVPLPVRARRRAGPGEDLVLGLGGDRAEPVPVHPWPRFLVAGPPGSGRSTALARLASVARAAGHRIVTDHWRDDDLDDLDEPVIVVDDLDELEAADPQSALTLERHLLARRRGAGGAWVLAATTLEHATTAFRGPTPLLVRAGTMLVLDPCAPGALELLGPRGGWLADPLERVPGRGVLRIGRELMAVQVFDH